jgi:hypothetical protein
MKKVAIAACFFMNTILSMEKTINPLTISQTIRDIKKQLEIVSDKTPHCQAISKPEEFYFKFSVMLDALQEKLTALDDQEFLTEIDILVEKQAATIWELNKKSNALLERLDAAESKNKDLAAMNEQHVKVEKKLFLRINELTTQNKQFNKEITALKAENENLHFLRTM